MNSYSSSRVDQQQGQVSWFAKAWARLAQVVELAKRVPEFVIKDELKSRATNAQQSFAQGDDEAVAIENVSAVRTGIERCIVGYLSSRTRTVTPLVAALRNEHLAKDLVEKAELALDNFDRAISTRTAEKMVETYLVVLDTIKYTREEQTRRDERAKFLATKPALGQRERTKVLDYQKRQDAIAKTTRGHLVAQRSEVVAELSQLF